MLRSGPLSAQGVLAVEHVLENYIYALMCVTLMSTLYHLEPLSGLYFNESTHGADALVLYGETFSNNCKTFIKIQK